MTTNSPATKYDSGCLEAIGIYKPGSNFLGSASPAHKEAKGPFAAAVEYAPRPELEDPGCLVGLGVFLPKEDAHATRATSVRDPVPALA